MNLNGAEQLLITTSSQEATILQLPDLMKTANFKLSGPATTSFASPQCPNVIFFGTASPG